MQVLLAATLKFSALRFGARFVDALLSGLPTSSVLLGLFNAAARGHSHFGLIDRPKAPQADRYGPLASVRESRPSFSSDNPPLETSSSKAAELMARARRREEHRVGRLGWLRAAVLGANDGLLSTASVIIGVASAHTGHAAIMIAGVAALIAGAMSMAAGEYVSVSSQADAEKADLKREAAEICRDPKGEREELAGIYTKRGLDRGLADQVAGKLMEKDALKAHARDELGLSDDTKARPLQAAIASAVSFAFGAATPLGVAAVAPHATAVQAVSATSLAILVLLGGLGAKVGGAPILKAAARVTLWGAVRHGGDRRGWAAIWHISPMTGGDSSTTLPYSAAGQCKRTASRLRV